MSRVLEPKDYKRVAWKNGLGSTLELATDAPDWTWRLSIADVPAAAPFSNFPGVDRFLACLEGPGLRIFRDGKSVLVPSGGEALAFGGEEVVSGEPLGPGVRDVNLMVRRERWKGTMIVSRSRSIEVEGKTVLIYASSTARAKTRDAAFELTAGSTLIIDGRVSLEGSVVACSLSPR